MKKKKKKKHKQHEAPPPPKQRLQWKSSRKRDHQSHQSALISARGLRRVLRLFNLRNNQVKRFRDVKVQEGTGLGEGTVDLLGQLPAFVQSDLSLFRLEVALISHYDQWNLVRSLKGWLE